MPPIALAIVLAAALLHAAWNLVVKSSRDRLVAAWLQITFGALVFLPALLTGGGVPWSLWGFVLVSSVVHVFYGVTLAAAYEAGDLSVVYPIARGSAPLLVTVGGILLLADRPDLLGGLAVVVVTAGILVIGLRGRPGRGLPFALATGLTIATYMLVDTAAVRAGTESLRYTVAVFVGNALLFTPVVLLRRSPARLGRILREEGWRHALGGAASLVAYALVLLAARSAPVGLVAALRETSVVFGALGGWLLLGEPMGRRRLEGALVIAAGIVLLAVA